MSLKFDNTATQRYTFRSQLSFLIAGFTYLRRLIKEIYIRMQKQFYINFTQTLMIMAEKSMD